MIVMFPTFVSGTYKKKVKNMFYIEDIMNKRIKILGIQEKPECFLSTQNPLLFVGDAIPKIIKNKRDKKENNK